MKKEIVLASVILVIATIVIFKPTSEPYNIELKDESEFIKRNLVTGGPPKDGIPAIDNPVYFSAEESSLKDTDKIFGINYQGFVAAYPQDILYWHEIVNEEVRDEKIAITYCPLTESVIGYKAFNLGVSGELYNSNLVMYDRKTDVRIPQILGKGIEGEIDGHELETFPVVVTTWGKWKGQYPETKVLSRDTGYARDYDRNPYPGYDDILRVWFPLAAESNELETKEIVLGIQHNEEFVAIQKQGFLEEYPDGLKLNIGDETVKVTYNEEFDVLESNADKSFEVYWFAWYAYHPTTKLVA